MKCEQCSTELDAELPRFERVNFRPHHLHTQERCLQAQLSEAAVKYRTVMERAVEAERERDGLQKERASLWLHPDDIAKWKAEFDAEYKRAEMEHARAERFRAALVLIAAREWDKGRDRSVQIALAALADPAAHSKPSAHARLVEALGYASTWPVTDVLRRLADAARHLLDVHNCDRTGWEEVSSCAKHADEIAAAIEAALAPAPASPAAPPSPGTTENLAEQLGALLAEAGIRPWFHKAGCSMWKGTRICDKGCGPPEKKP